MLAHPKKARKRKKKRPDKIALESEESTGLVLQLQELGLPSAFGTSKASHMPMPMQAAAVDIDGPARLAAALVKLPLHQHTVHDFHDYFREKHMMKKRIAVFLPAILPMINNISLQKMSTIMMTALMTSCSVLVRIYRQFMHRRVHVSGSRPMMMHMAAFTTIGSVLR